MVVVLLVAVVVVLLVVVVVVFNGDVVVSGVAVRGMRECLNQA
jgi:hypothetical protein